MRWKRTLKIPTIPLSIANPIRTIAPIRGAITGDINTKVKVSSVMALWSNIAIVIKPKK